MNRISDHPQSRKRRFAVLSLFVAGLLFCGAACGPDAAEETKDTMVSTAPLTLVTWTKWSEYKKGISFTAGKDLTIPSTANITFDGDKVDTFGKLTINGGFRCADGARTLKAKAILVSGAGASFTCGGGLADSTSSGYTQVPRKDGFTIELFEQAAFSKDEMMAGCSAMDMDMSMVDSGYQAFAVTCGATLDLNGFVPTVLWTRLSSTATPGGKTLTVKDMLDCSVWKNGEEVAIASSSFDDTQSEQRTIQSCASSAAGSVIAVSSALEHSHFGGPQVTYTAGTKTLPLVNQAEVALLSRRIRFKGTETDKKAAHMLFMSAPGNIRIGGVEFSTVGRMGELGRYPAHFHRVKDHIGRDAWIKNSSIHGSFSRCVTLHETNNVQIVNNICYDHYGHGFFLEEGNETGNVFERNLGFRTKETDEGRQLLETDRTSLNPHNSAGASTFWISNPDNVYKNNVAAGSAGSGFWFGLKDAAHIPDMMTVPPVNTAMRQFEGNLAHSCSQGVTVDQGPNGDCPTTANPRNPCSGGSFDKDTADFPTKQTVYMPSTSATIKKLTAYKCRDFGIWFSARGRNVITDSIFADNQLHVGLVFDSVLRDSVIVAKTDNFDPAVEIPMTFPKGVVQKTFAATLIYDGPNFLDNVHFEGFPTTLTYTDSTGKTTSYDSNLFSLTTAAANRSPSHRVRGLSFGAGNTTPYTTVTTVSTGKTDGSYGLGTKILADFQHDLAHPNKDNWSAGVWDMDGSLTGKTNSTVVPKEQISNVSDCSSDSRFLNALICPGRFGHVELSSTTLQFDLLRRNSDADLLAASPSGSFSLPATPSSAKAPYADHQWSYPLSQATTNTYTVALHAQQNVTTAVGAVPMSNLSNGVPMRMDWLNKGDRSPQIEIYQLYRACKLKPIWPATELPLDVSATTTDGDVVKLQLVANTQNIFPGSSVAIGQPSAEGYAGQDYASSPFVVLCYVPSSVDLTSPTVWRNERWRVVGRQCTGGTLSGNLCKGGQWTGGQAIGTHDKNKTEPAAILEAHVATSAMEPYLNLVVSYGPDRGHANIYVDEKLTNSDVSFYQLSYGQYVRTIVRPTTYGEHTIRIESVDSGAKTPSGYTPIIVPVSITASSTMVATATKL